MEEKENFKNLRARFHMNRQDLNESRSWKPSSSGNQPALSAAITERHGFVSNQLVKKDGSTSVLPTKPPVPKKMDPAHGSSSQIPQAWVQERSPVSHLNFKNQGEVAKFATRESTSSLETSPCFTFQKTRARKVSPERNSKMDALVSIVPQRSKATEIQQSLMEKFAQNQHATKGIVTIPDKVPSLPVAQKSASNTSLNIPKRKPLPSEKVLGPRPEKPRRPPLVNLDRFRKSPVNKTEMYPANRRNSDQSLQKPLASSPLHSRAQVVPRTVLPPELPQPSVPLPKKEVHFTSSPIRTGKTASEGKTEKEEYDDVVTAGTYNKGTAPSRVQKCMSPRREQYYDDVLMVPVELIPPTVNLCELKPGWKNEKDLKRRQKEENEFRKKFKFEGEINVVTRMMVTPSAGVKKGGGKDLPFRKGEIMDVIQLTNQEKIICRNAQGKYGYVPKRFLLQIEREIYDDVGIHEELYDDIELIVNEQPPLPPKPRLSNEAKLNNEKNLIKTEKEEKEFRKKFKFEGEIKVMTRMMVTPSVGIKKGGGKDLPIKGGEILDVIQIRSKDKVICRDTLGKYGYVRKNYLLQLELDVYDDVDN